MPNYISITDSSSLIPLDTRKLQQPISEDGLLQRLGAVVRVVLAVALWRAVLLDGDDGVL